MKTFINPTVTWLAIGVFAATAQSQDYFPLERGATWVYEASGPFGNEEYARKVWNVLPDGTRQLRLGGTYSYLRKTDYGITSIGYAYKGGDLPRLDEPGEPFLKLPIVLGDTWEFESLARVQTVARPGEPTPDFRVKNVVRVSQAIEEVTVPAGTFKAVRIETDSTGQNVGQSKRVVFLVDGVGLVKAIETGEYGTTTIELKEFSKGRDVSDSEIKRAVARFAGVAPEMLIAFQDKNAHHLFRSRFFSLGKKLFRYTGGTVSRFDPLDSADWKALSVEDRSLRGPAWIELGEIVAKLAAVGAGFDFNRVQVSFLYPATAAGANFKVTEPGKEPIVISVKTNSDGSAQVKARRA